MNTSTANTAPIKTPTIKKVLIIKTSSLGDVIHTLPALSDAVARLGEVQFDWVVEENFAEIPAWHPAVNKVIPVAIRRWRKQIFKTLFSGEWQSFKVDLQVERYDVVIDAQGLIKSALITRMAKGKRYGLDKSSAREPLAAKLYQYPQAIDKDQHAVERVRQLFAQSLGYSLDGLTLQYGISEKLNTKLNAMTAQKQVLFLHGTTWATKHWPEKFWLELAQRLSDKGYTILLPWGNEIERQRAVRIKNNTNVVILDKMNLHDLAQQIDAVDAVVAVDTGLAHLAAALDKATIALYGPTSPGLTGTYGQHQQHLQSTIDCAPCFQKNCDKQIDDIRPACYSFLTPEQVFNELDGLLNEKETQQ
ncbi:lipopolysaccharide heptosyltransferase I [sulfur-oxidizing endosymbiont of Gigantopelta aegis]|uniref:lipopolysaccharide heptosyltransferase I n=1 Tax=sulfur-oxidizing endosymbiont of Gigantopelta aegis TaxID=2794934 RepID=UPI001FE6197B|nr:lipopolysaccharide heptosyltransferase I [sulfur-oxidizing endosymbiont of Gigantopelta aegis]